MYYVVFVDHKDEDTYTEVTLFKSNVERDCWDFVKSRLIHERKQVRKSAAKLYVQDKLRQFCDPPDDVKALKKNEFKECDIPSKQINDMLLKFG